MVLGRYRGKAVAEAYASFRPQYPATLYDAICTFCNIKHGRKQSLALDLACGPGISTSPLAEHFDRVIGIDVSQAQVDNAPNIDNVQFRVGPAEDLSFLSPNTVDLITTASGLHWLNRTQLFPEVRRVLRPEGTFAAYGYGLPRVDHPQADQVLQKFIWDKLGPWRDPETFSAVHHHYRDIKIPFADVMRTYFPVERSTDVTGLINYFKTSSSYVKFMAHSPHSAALSDFEKELVAACDTNTSEPKDILLKVIWSGFLVMGRKGA